MALRLVYLVLVRVLGWLALGERADRFRFLIRDRDSKFTAAFDAASQAPTSASSAPLSGHRGERNRGTIPGHCAGNASTTY